MRARFAYGLVAATLFFATELVAADFGSKDGVAPANIDEITEILRQDTYDLELLISFGTSKGGSAGHLALAVRDGVPGDDLVYSANFYADRSDEHASGFYTADLMLGIPKKEYLFKTSSSLADTAAFGLDFGEIYKRSVIGVRVYGVPADEKTAVTDFFQRVNADYHRQAEDTEYHDGEVKYDYMRLNCAKTIGAAFRFGAGYEHLEVTSARLLKRRRIVVAATANIPMEMAMKLIKEWGARGYAMDVVLYKKYDGSTFVDPHDEPPVAFKDLPNRFPSVLSRDFRRDAGEYEDFDNLYAMHLLYSLGRYRVQVNEQTLLLEVKQAKNTKPYAEAVELATAGARSDMENNRRKLLFRSKGKYFWESADNSHLYDFTEDGKRQPSRE
ncbi:conserved exported hypothetical protein [Candidatus Propionivibrio aalborgensis]|uniref:Lipoprotein n=1 Tax=Candidatus Propionivibrio aalborgensis TaxID=1860101 RepID=A0A1A8Y0Y9_9RHOO|nr:hypothetical protein [Candidatus Propionivibrio aalborgensis]SBT10621.1 conserved exported hypothetical protein [Candidatus Propionivibrio aalborgensis]